MTSTLPLYALPALGAPWPGQGGLFAGLRLGADGRSTEALILAEAKPPGLLKWKPAAAWAKTIEADGHADFTLPDREEARLMWVNTRDQFEPNWYWLSVETDGSYAWGQNYVDGGYTYYYRKSYEGRARAVRRFVLQSFDPSGAQA